MVFDIESQGRLSGRVIGFAALVALVLSAGPASAQNLFQLFQPPPPPPPQQQMAPTQRSQPPQRSQPAPRPQQPSPPRAPRVQKPLAAPAASASPNAPFGEVRSACGAEIKATCAGVVPGSADSVQCLKRNFAFHSPACQAALTRAGNQPVQPVAAPANPAAPAGTADEPRRIPTDRVESAAAPEEPLKMAPVTKLRPTQEARFVSRYCREDQSLLCQGVPYGHGRVLTCLAGRPGSLTRECKRALVSRR